MLNRTSIVLLAAISLVLCGSANSQPLGQRERTAIGIIEVEILDADGNSIPGKGVERGTGAIISRSGHVLTAGHLLADGRYEICAGAASATSGETCEIRFYQRGMAAQEFHLTINPEFQLSNNLDYIVLDLPDPSDAINADEWPSLYIGTSIEANELLTGAGYAGTTKLSVASNPLRSISGNYFPSLASPCPDAGTWGNSTSIGTQSEPGYSGGPVMNSRGRIVGIILGRGCETGLQAKPTTRILELKRIPNLCSRIECRYGLPGYIAPRPEGSTSRWQDRLEGGPAAADAVHYGVQMSVISAMNPPIGLACVVFNLDSEALKQARADADRGGELATVLLANWYSCGSQSTSGEWDTVRNRVFALADRGYEPAVAWAAIQVVSELFGKIALYRSGNYTFSESELAKIQQSYDYLDEAADGGWAAASYMRFNLCAEGIVACVAKRADLEFAAQSKHVDALRNLALLQLIGPKAEELLRRHLGFTVEKDVPAAIQQFRLNAIPSFMSGKWRYWDSVSAFYLLYLSSGSKYLGQKLLPPSLTDSMSLQATCFDGGIPQYQNALHRKCFLFGLIARFNLAPTKIIREQAISDFQQDATNPDLVGALSGNISSWLQQNPSITTIECELSADFEFLMAPAFVPALNTANCYFPASPT